MTKKIHVQKFFVSVLVEFVLFLLAFGLWHGPSFKANQV